MTRRRRGQPPGGHGQQQQGRQPGTGGPQQSGGGTQQRGGQHSGRAQATNNVVNVAVVYSPYGELRQILRFVPEGRDQAGAFCPLAGKVVHLLWRGGSQDVSHDQQKGYTTTLAIPEAERSVTINCDGWTETIQVRGGAWNGQMTKTPIGQRVPAVGQPFLARVLDALRNAAHGGNRYDDQPGTPSNAIADINTALSRLSPTAGSWLQSDHVAFRFLVALLMAIGIVLPMFVILNLRIGTLLLIWSGLTLTGAFSPYFRLSAVGIWGSFLGSNDRRWLTLALFACLSFVFWTYTPLPPTADQRSQFERAVGYAQSQNWIPGTSATTPRHRPPTKDDSILRFLGPPLPKRGPSYHWWWGFWLALASLGSFPILFWDNIHAVLADRRKEKEEKAAREQVLQAGARSRLPKVEFDWRTHGLIIGGATLALDTVIEWLPFIRAWLRGEQRVQQQQLPSQQSVQQPQPSTPPPTQQQQRPPTTH